MTPSDSPPSPTTAGSATASSLPSFHASVLQRLGWELAASLTLPGRPAAFAQPAELPHLSAPASALVAQGGPLYRHQALALHHAHAGRHVVLSTSTGSGKTRVFHLAAVDALARDPRALILALYPGKALAREQAAKWESVLATAGLATANSGAVASLTGDQSDKKARLASLSAARVAVMTPDVLHAWLLSHLAETRIRAALCRLRLVIVDEAHTSAGTFGSNCLWLFRRLQHALHTLRVPAPLWLAASATLARPADHLAALTGLAFVAVTEADDTSPRHPRHLHFVRPSATQPLLGGLGAWLRACVDSPDSARLAVFTQSRKQTEVIAHIANRGSAQPASPDDALSEEEQADTLTRTSHRLAPYRSGLSASERAELQDRFARGELRGLVCTSAFELGIDLPGLDLGFLAGLPESPASFWQRLGRFGRHGESHVFLLHDATDRTEQAFRDPPRLLDWQARDGALYPDNPILLARHVLCLAQETAALGRGDHSLASGLPFTPAFRAEFAALQRGELTPALREAQQYQGNTQPPHLAFPLRTVDETYTFRGVRDGHSPEGFITHAQLLREAYPGAVYYHAGTSWRVTHLNRRRRELTVARERAYRTEPRALPSTFIPDLSAPVWADLRWSSGLRLLEAPGRATEWVTGFTERRGGHVVTAGDYAGGAYGQHGPLYRAYDTTGILLLHPALSETGVRHELLGTLLRQAMLALVPREAAEVAVATGQLKAARRQLAQGTRFVALYDTVPGSLRLTAVLADPAVLRATLELVRTNARDLLGSSHDSRDLATLAAVAALAHTDFIFPPERLPSDWPEALPAQVFAPGTRALHRRLNVEVRVLRVLTDLDGAIVYDVARCDDPAAHGTLPADRLSEIPGRTEFRPVSECLALAS